MGPVLHLDPSASGMPSCCSYAVRGRGRGRFSAGPKGGRLISRCSPDPEPPHPPTHFRSAPQATTASKGPSQPLYRRGTVRAAPDPLAMPPPPPYRYPPRQAVLIAGDDASSTASPSVGSPARGDVGGPLSGAYKMTRSSRGSSYQHSVAGPLTATRASTFTSAALPEMLSPVSPCGPSLLDLVDALHGTPTAGTGTRPPPGHSRRSYLWCCSPSTGGVSHLVNVDGDVDAGTDESDDEEQVPVIRTTSAETVGEHVDIDDIASLRTDMNFSRDASEEPLQGALGEESDAEQESDALNSTCCPGYRALTRMQTMPYVPSSFSGEVYNLDDTHHAVLSLSADWTTGPLHRPRIFATSSAVPVSPRGGSSTESGRPRDPRLSLSLARDDDTEGNSPLQMPHWRSMSASSTRTATPTHRSAMLTSAVSPASLYDKQLKPPLAVKLERGSSPNPRTPVAPPTRFNLTPRCNATDMDVEDCDPRGTPLYEQPDLAAQWVELLLRYRNRENEETNEDEEPLPPLLGATQSLDAPSLSPLRCDLLAPAMPRAFSQWATQQRVEAVTPRASPRSSSLVPLSTISHLHLQGGEEEWRSYLVPKDIVCLTVRRELLKGMEQKRRGILERASFGDSTALM